MEEEKPIIYMETKQRNLLQPEAWERETGTCLGFTLKDKFNIQIEKPFIAFFEKKSATISRLKLVN